MFCVALLIAINLDWKIAFAALTFALCAFYGGVVGFRMASVLFALLKSGEHRVSRDEINALQDADLPIYTILVPMYKEPEVAQKIARTVTKLDYPIDKLDVKLLLEEDDAPTRAKIDEVLHTLPPCVQVIIAPKIPKGQPRTKPRACNWGLEAARGKYLVIYDAEDQPEPDQLKKAVVVFRKLEAQKKDRVVCLQAKLNYFNVDQNWLTKFFTLEYTTWFDLFLPGLHSFHAAIPLGGTSNHFKTEVLKQIGGWDSFNVTEDCDLGIRLARQGQSTEVLDSTTWEEANSQYGNWVRQRSRWIKGYFQTHLVHTRDAWLPSVLMAGVCAWLYFYTLQVKTEPMTMELHPTLAAITEWGSLGLCAAFGVIALLSLGQRLIARAKGRRQLGPLQALEFRFTVGGLSLMMLLNFIFWGLTLLYIFRHDIAAILPSSIANYPLTRTSTVREHLDTWELLHQNVVDSAYTGVTLYNSIWGFITQKLTFATMIEHIKMVDRWSLVSQIFYPVAVVLFLGNFIIVLMGLISCAKRNLWRLFGYALLMPIYWVMISRAAVKGFWQLFWNPWYWEKTTHGLTHDAAPPSPPAVETVH
ncbi:MAG TPA: glycosyltransferase [Planctomycetota bacterium]|nr:glycosyltransferase [Planctomycetota bacterium]